MTQIAACVVSPYSTADGGYNAIDKKTNARNAIAWFVKPLTVLFTDALLSPRLFVCCIGLTPFLTHPHQPHNMQPMSPKGKLHEQGFNYALAKALRTCNPEWNESTVIAERTGGAKRPDIEIDTDNMPKVVIECAFEGDGGMDAKARLDNSELKIETAISIDIPKAFESMAEETAAQKLIDGAEIGYAVLQKKDFRFPEQGYLSGTVRDLAAFIQVASVSKDSVERVADEVVELIRGAGGKLHAHMSTYARDKIVQLIAQHSNLNGMQTAAVLWLDAMLVQSKIHKSGDMDINPLPMPDDVDPVATRARVAQNSAN